MSVKRFDQQYHGCCMIALDDGDWVDYEDYKKLEEEVERLRVFKEMMLGSMCEWDRVEVLKSWEDNIKYKERHK